MEPFQHTEIGTEASHEQFVAPARQLQIIGGALIMGCISFGMLVLALKGISEEVYEGAGVITWMGLVMGCMMLANSFIVPMMMGRREGTSIESWLGIFRSKSIVGMALCEGGAFFNLVAYMINTQLLSLGVAILLLARLVTLLPTAGGIEIWVGHRMRAAEQGF